MSYKMLWNKVEGERYEHRLVWKQHHGNIPKGMHVHHINGIKDDNRIENLSLVSFKQNMNKSDRWGKGYVYYPAYKLPYRAKRRGQLFGGYGTACGAYMKSMMAYITGDLDVNYA